MRNSVLCAKRRLLIVKITAVLVLYNQTPEESRALSTLLPAIRQHVAEIDLIVYDNGPVSQFGLIAANSFLRYVHNSANGMLYAAYSYALREAASSGTHWLMLLDQDTEITPEYVSEVLELCGDQEEKVLRSCAIVPFLLVGSTVRSPHRPSGSSQTSDHFIIESGLHRTPLCAWNSGAILNVERLLEIGGFPPEFPLDDLDYIIFHRLQESGQPVSVMKSQLIHSLSVGHVQTLSLARLKGKLAADLLLQRTLHSRSRISLALEFFRTGISLLRSVDDKRLGLLCFQFSAACFYSPLMLKGRS
jgi:GT2 family glycosyltransferase